MESTSIPFLVFVLGQKNQNEGVAANYPYNRPLHRNLRERLLCLTSKEFLFPAKPETIISAHHFYNEETKMGKTKMKQKEETKKAERDRLNEKNERGRTTEEVDAAPR